MRIGNNDLEYTLGQINCNGSSMHFGLLSSKTDPHGHRLRQLRAEKTGESIPSVKVAPFGRWASRKRAALYLNVGPHSDLRCLDFTPTRKAVAMADAWFQKDEYAALRKEVESCMAELATLEKVVVGGVAAIFAWVAKDGIHAGHLAAVAWLVPTVVALYGGLKAKAIESHLAVLGGYLRKIEIAQLPPDSKVEGWQAYFEKNSPGKRTQVTREAWVGLLVLTSLTSAIGFAKSI